MDCWCIGDCVLSLFLRSLVRGSAGCDLLAACDDGGFESEERIYFRGDFLLRFVGFVG